MWLVVWMSIKKIVFFQIKQNKEPVEAECHFWWVVVEHASTLICSEYIKERHTSLSCVELATSYRRRQNNKPLKSRYTTSPLITSDPYRHRKSESKRLFLFWWLSLCLLLKMYSKKDEEFAFKNLCKTKKSVLINEVMIWMIVENGPNSNTSCIFIQWDVNTFFYWVLWEIVQTVMFWPALACANSMTSEAQSDQKEVVGETCEEFICQRPTDRSSSSSLCACRASWLHLNATECHSQQTHTRSNKPKSLSLKTRTFITSAFSCHIQTLGCWGTKQGRKINGLSFITRYLSALHCCSNKQQPRESTK